MAGQQKFTLTHGPYLQEVTAGGATFVFLTSAKSVPSVELRKAGSNDVSLHYSVHYGLRDANETFHAIRVEHLEPGTRYEYRVKAKEMKEFGAYNALFGDSIATEWNAFNTIDPKKQGASIFVVSDIHNKQDRLKRLLELCDYQTCDHFFYAGDMMSEMTTMETPFEGFIDMSVKMFAKNTPFELVRGNHETRGELSRNFPHFFPKRDNRIYGSYLLGDIMTVMIDCGEDKPEDHREYFGLNEFDSYRTEQAEWLKELVKTKEFKKAKYRIVISHYPTTLHHYTWSGGETHGMDDLSRKLLPILNKAKIDLMVSGHTHEYEYIEQNACGNNFPILVGSDKSATRLDIRNGKISVKAIDEKGTVLLDKTL